MKEKQNITQEEFETIERYLTNEMTAEEQKAFVQKISGDPSLQQKVNEVRTLIDGIEASALKNTLDDFHKKLPQTHSKVVNKPKLITKSRKSKLPRYAIAAVLVIVFGISWFFNATDSNEKLFAEYFTPDPGLPTTMSTTTNYTFFDGMVDYKQKKYQAAIDKWKPLLAEKPKNDTLQYFMGVAHLANGDENTAIPFLKKIQKQQESIFYKDSFYYLGMAQLKKGNIEEAKENLQQSEQNNTQEILSELSN